MGEGLRTRATFVVDPSDHLPVPPRKNDSGPEQSQTPHLVRDELGARWLDAAQIGNTIDPRGARRPTRAAAVEAAAGQSLAGGTLTSTSTTGFADKLVTVAGGHGHLVRTRRPEPEPVHGNHGLHGNAGRRRAVCRRILEKGSGTGHHDAALQLIYTASVTIAARRRVTAGATSIAQQRRRHRDGDSAGQGRRHVEAGTASSRARVVTDPTDNKRYKARTRRRRRRRAERDTGELGGRDSKGHLGRGGQVYASAKSSSPARARSPRPTAP
jgi:hypothetical protein